MTSYDSNKEKFSALAQSLAVYFPDYIFNSVENHWRGSVYFEAKNDPFKGFYLGHDGKGKMNVSAKIERKPHHSFDIYVGNDKLNPPEVGFSIDRDPEKIADGIKKRFMPDFELYFKLWTEKWQQIEDAKNNKEAAIKEFALLLGGVDTTDYVRGGVRENLSTYHSPNKNLKSFISDVRVSSPDSIEIKTHYLTAAQAKVLLEFIKGL
jgi:hypothetical protein